MELGTRDDDDEEEEISRDLIPNSQNLLRCCCSFLLLLLLLLLKSCCFLSGVPLLISSVVNVSFFRLFCAVTLYSVYLWTGHS